MPSRSPLSWAGGPGACVFSSMAYGKGGGMSLPCSRNITQDCLANTSSLEPPCGLEGEQPSWEVHGTGSRRQLPGAEGGRQPAGTWSPRPYRHQDVTPAHNLSQPGHRRFPTGASRRAHHLATLAAALRGSRQDPLSHARTPTHRNREMTERVVLAG